MYLHGVRGIRGAVCAELPDIPTLLLRPSRFSPNHSSSLSFPQVDSVNAKFAVSFATELKEHLPASQAPLYWGIGGLYTHFLFIYITDCSILTQ